MRSVAAARRNLPASDSRHGGLQLAVVNHGWVYGLVVIAVLFAVLPTGLSWNFDLREDMADGSPIRKLQWMSLFLWAFYLAWRVKFKYFSELIWGNILLWVLLMFSGASAAWSHFPMSAIRQWVQFLGILLLVYVVSIYMMHDARRVFLLCFYTLMAVLVLSILVVVVNPVQGLESVAGIEGAWRGALEQKNMLGIASGVALLLWVFVQTTYRRSTLSSVASISVILICLLGSRSSSSLFFGLVSVGLYFVLYKDHIRAARLFLRFVLILMATFLLANILFFFYADRFLSFSDVAGPFSGIFGKSSDLTGRSDIWALMWNSISRHWYFGVGFSSFWLGPGGPSQYISDALQWMVPTAHNGYLEVLNELGLVGVFLFAGMLVLHLNNIVFIFNIDRHLTALHMAILLIFLISNFSESTALRVTSFLQFLLFLSMATTQAACLKVKMRTVELHQGVGV